MMKEWPNLNHNCFKEIINTGGNGFLKIWKYLETRLKHLCTNFRMFEIKVISKTVDFSTVNKLRKLKLINTSICIINMITRCFNWKSCNWRIFDTVWKVLQQYKIYIFYFHSLQFSRLLERSVVALPIFNIKRMVTSST